MDKEVKIVKLAESRNVSAVGKLKLQASSFIIGELEHPNMMPFSGTLTFFDAPSDMAPHGSGGRKVLIPSEVGVPALGSLKGMAVNYIEGSMDDHAPQAKIGVITDAYVGARLPDGSLPVQIEGYIYALDFEDAATQIKLNQNSLGFSYETAKTSLMDGLFDGEPVAVVSQLGYFTGASILWRASAAYHQTSIAASAEKEMEGKSMDKQATPNEILTALKEAIKHIDAITDQVMAQYGIPDQDKDEKESVKASAVSTDEQVPPADGIKASSEEKDEENADEEPKLDENKDEVVVDEVKPEDEVEAKEDVKDDVATPDQEVASEDQVNEPEPSDVKEEQQPSGDAQPTETGDANLNASALLEEVEALKAELATLKSEASIQASARKSIAYPSTLLAKYETEGDSKTKVLASIDADENLTVEQRFALKLEALSKLEKQ